MANATPLSFRDPFDQYKRSEEPITVRELAVIWHTEARDGYSYSTLRKRCAKEKWGDARLKYMERARNIIEQRELKQTANVHAGIISGWTEKIDRITAGAMRFLDQYEPPPTANPHDAAMSFPDYRSPKEAAQVALEGIKLDRQVRGMDIQRVKDVTDDEDPTDVYANLSDPELQELAESDEEDTGGGPA